MVTMEHRANHTTLNIMYLQLELVTSPMHTLDFYSGNRNT